MTALVITVDVRSVYGRDTIYPLDEPARAFARIAGTTTLTPDVLKEIIGLGYEVRYCQFKPVLVMRDGSTLQVARADLEAALVDPIERREYCSRCEQLVRLTDDGEACAQCKLVL